MMHGVTTRSLSIPTFVFYIIHFKVPILNVLQRQYTVFAFVPGYEDITGKALKLDHIQDLNSRPLDDLFRDHFLQAVLKNMKGVGEPNWDYEDALGGGSVDLSRMDLWGGKLGKAHLEFEMAHRLHGFQVETPS